MHTNFQQQAEMNQKIRADRAEPQSFAPYRTRQQAPGIIATVALSGICVLTLSVGTTIAATVWALRPIFRLARRSA